MKKVLMLLSVVFLLLLISCNSGESYKMETFYSNDKGNGDTTMIGKTSTIRAASDSLAWVKAEEAFNATKSKADNKDGMPVKFTLRDKDDVIVAGPDGLNPPLRELMYPNQTP
ncbi:hypothetical protein BH11BAC3_BH11BAC3_08130 [soil metagenome]